jgi:hypothetical protein
MLIAMLSVIMLSFFILNVIHLIVVILSDVFPYVVAPLRSLKATHSLDGEVVIANRPENVCCWIDGIQVSF